MEQEKYYDHKNDRPLDVERDGCPLAEWDEFYGRATFAWHPMGFPVFLSPEELRESDEYFERDPYGVLQGLDSDFQLRRIEITIALLSKAAGWTQTAPRILDLGCGQGHITKRMGEALKDAEITALDHSLSAIEYAYEHFSGIDFAVGDAYEPPYSYGYYDIVVCNNLWEHVPDPLFLLGKIYSMLKPGGFLIVSTPSRYRLSNLARVLRGKPIAFMSDHHVTEYTVGQVMEQLKYGGFAVKDVISKPIRLGSLQAELARRLLSIPITFVGSHHQLEATVFFLAQKASGAAE